MKDLTIRTQAEFDVLPPKFDEYTKIIISGNARLQILRIPENAHAELRENAHAELWGNAHAELWGNAHAELRENAHAEVYGCAAVHLKSDYATVVLFMFAICVALAKGKISKKSEAATVVVPEFPQGVDGWLNQQGIADADSETVILYKRVSRDFRTQEGKEWETSWAVGSLLEHPQWNPIQDECGAGKFHACSKPYFCDEFRNGDRSDRYVAVEVAKLDLYAWRNPEYPHKIAFRRGRVLYECDRYGKELAKVAAAQ